MKKATNARPKYEIIDIDKTEIAVDISMLSKTRSLYFNATAIAKQFGKQSGDFLKTEDTSQYIQCIIDDKKCNDLSRYDSIIKTTQRGKHAGTWLHQKLALRFARWCSVSFEYQLDQWIGQRIEDEHVRKIARDTAKTGFLPLTNAIKDAHQETKAYHYSNECNLINKLVLGMSAKQFKEQHQIESVRDGCDVFQLYLFDKLQRINTALIELGKGYDERKQTLAILVNREALEVF